MRDILDDSSKKAIVRYRIEKSEQALKEARILADHNLYDSAVSRLYYECYYMASALLIANKIESTTHAGVKRMLSLNFIQPGILEHKYLRTLSNLMQGRTMRL